MIKTLKNKKGVTLVELLAVIVIMGIIAAIAVPAIGSLIARQQTSADIASANNVLAAAQIYATENPNEASVDSDVLVSEGLIVSNPFKTVVTFTITDGVVDGATAEGGVMVNDTTLELSEGKFVEKTT